MKGGYGRHTGRTNPPKSFAQVFFPKIHAWQKQRQAIKEEQEARVDSSIAGFRRHRDSGVMPSYYDTPSRTFFKKMLSKGVNFQHPNMIVKHEKQIAQASSDAMATLRAKAGRAQAAITRARAAKHF